MSLLFPQGATSRTMVLAASVIMMEVTVEFMSEVTTIITTIASPEIEACTGRNVFLCCLVCTIIAIPPALDYSVAQPSTLVAPFCGAFWHVVGQLS